MPEECGTELSANSEDDNIQSRFMSNSVIQTLIIYLACSEQYGVCTVCALSSTYRNTMWNINGMCPNLCQPGDSYRSVELEMFEILVCSDGH